jgi:hypothetical protein
MIAFVLYGMTGSEYSLLRIQISVSGEALFSDILRVIKSCCDR